MAKTTLAVPDIGGSEDAEVIEICVAVGDAIELEQSLIVLESDKASMEIPATAAGTVAEILVKEGDQLAEGAPIVVVETDGGSADAEGSSTEAEGSSTEAEGSSTEAEGSTDGGGDEAKAGAGDGAGDSPGDSSAEGSDISPAEGSSPEKAAPKADSEPADAADAADGSAGDSADGSAGDSAKAAPEADVGSKPADAADGSAGDSTKVASKPGTAADSAAESAQSAQPPQPGAAAAGSAAGVSASAPSGAAASQGGAIHAGPAVRKLAREFGVDLSRVPASGPKGRILKEDIQNFVKQSLQEGSDAGAGIPLVPKVDFAAFGEVDIQPLTKVDKITAANMHRSWLNVPHVTQFGEADVTDMEAFRVEMKKEAERHGVKLTPLPFLLKACATALRDNPRFNASLAGDGEHIVYKQFVHVGVAVDTEAGLMVPVIRDVDRKNLWELAAETAELAVKARERKLKPADMQGGCFTISSLGNIGGTGFTPIINTPEVAILGVSKLQVKPVWNGEDFEPRKLLPLSLSYDHRVVNGADAGRFMAQLDHLLADIRRLLL